MEASMASFMPRMDTIACALPKLAESNSCAAMQHRHPQYRLAVAVGACAL
jgi:hypothetical protein